jgi:hypothetical protein
MWTCLSVIHLPTFHISRQDYKNHVICIMPVVLEVSSAATGWSLVAVYLFVGSSGHVGQMLYSWMMNWVGHERSNHGLDWSNIPLYALEGLRNKPENLRIIGPCSKFGPRLSLMSSSSSCSGRMRFNSCSLYPQNEIGPPFLLRSSYVSSSFWFIL